MVQTIRFDNFLENCQSKIIESRISLCFHVNELER